MDYIKKYFKYKVKANSLLESVIALTIISVCLYISIIVYTAVFTKSTTIKAYSSQNKVYELFFLMQAGDGNIPEEYDNDSWNIETDNIDNIKQIDIKYTDSMQSYSAKTFYIPVY